MQPRHATHARQPTLSRMNRHRIISTLPATATLPAVSADPATATLPAVMADPATATLPAVMADPATATLPAVMADPATATLPAVDCERTVAAELMVAMGQSQPTSAVGVPKLVIDPSFRPTNRS